MSNLGLASTSVAYKSFLAGNAVYVPFTPTGSYESIATYTVGAGGSSTVSFSSIPQTYTHLQLRCVTRTSATGAGSWQSMVFAASYNSGATGYDNHYLYSDGTSAIAGTELLGNRINFGSTAGNGAGANLFGVCVIDILDASSTSKYKTIIGLDGYDNNGSGIAVIRSGLWQSTNAITDITLGPENFGGITYRQYSTFALYGVK
jgi:hypothetical protein